MPLIQALRASVCPPDRCAGPSADATKHWVTNEREGTRIGGAARERKNELPVRPEDASFRWGGLRAAKRVIGDLSISNCVIRLAG